MLVEILCILPNLESLSMLTLSILRSNSLSAENTQNHGLISTNNKIKKVKLTNVTKMKRIELILSICSCMQYLELGYKPCMQIEVLMKYILIQRMKRIPNLYFSRFNI